MRRRWRHKEREGGRERGMRGREEKKEWGEREGDEEVS